MSVPEGIDKNFFFQNRECEFFPCHKDIEVERFNCMLCYCPLYALGHACNGNFRYTKKGVKDCTKCTIPHDGDSGVISVHDRFKELIAVGRREDERVGIFVEIQVEEKTE